MIRSTVHSSYPRFGDYGPDGPLRNLLDAQARGEPVDAAEIDELLTALGTIVVAEQSRAFVDVVTDGLVRQEGPMSAVVGGLAGLQPGGVLPWLESNVEDRRPICSGEIGRETSLLGTAYGVAVDVAQKPLKLVLPGPVTTARLADDRHYGDLDRLCDALAAALAEEVAELAGRGADQFQLDEPLLCRHPEDVERVARTASTVFAAAGDGATTVLSTYFGSLEAVADRLGQLPGTHLGIDATDDEGLSVLAGLPDGRGVALGLFDARIAEAEDAEVVAARLRPFRETLVARDVLVGPNAGLAGRSRDDAFEKLLQSRYLAEKLSSEWDWSAG